MELSELLPKLESAIEARDLGTAQDLITESYRICPPTYAPNPKSEAGIRSALQRRFNKIRDAIDEANNYANPVRDPETGTVWTYSSVDGVERYERG